MNGKHYLAVVELTDQTGAVLAAPDETCERVPESSLPWLLEQGLIVPGFAATGAAEEAEA